MSKIYHRAKYLNAEGQVSALCYKRKRPIDLTRESWALTDKGVNCPKCLKLIADKAGAETKEGA